MHKGDSILTRQTIIEVTAALSIVTVVVVVGTAALFQREANDAASHRQSWCAQTCGANKVLVCQMVKDPAWKEDRRAVGCLLDPEGSEVRFVIEQPGKVP